MGEAARKAASRGSPTVVGGAGGRRGGIGPAAEHALGDAAQDVDLLGLQLRAGKQAPQARHQLLRLGRIEKADLDQAALQVREHAVDLLGGGRLADEADAVDAGIARAGIGQQRHAHFIRDQLHRLRQVERRIGRVGGDMGDDVAALHHLVGQTVALVAEDEGDRRPRRSQQGRHLLRGGARTDPARAELARTRRQRNDERSPGQRLAEIVDDPGIGEHVIGAACHGNGVGMRLRTGLARTHQHIAAGFAESHGLQRACRRTDIAGMAGFHQHEAATGGTLPQGVIVAGRAGFRGAGGGVHIQYGHSFWRRDRTRRSFFHNSLCCFA